MLEMAQMNVEEDQGEGALTLYGQRFSSRLLLGTALYPSPALLSETIERSNPSLLTVSLRRETAGSASGERFWAFIKALNVPLLPNTAACHTVKEAVTTAHMARELFQTNWIKLEVIGNDDVLHPDLFQLVEAARILNDEGFHVFPYTTEDLGVAEKLVHAGCQVIMPWGAPIGSARGLNNPYALKSLRAYFPDIPLIIDAGLGAPSHAARAMEMGYDAILLNTAIAKAIDPPHMGEAFQKAIVAGHMAFQAGLMAPRDMARPSTPMAGTPFRLAADDEPL